MKSPRIGVLLLGHSDYQNDVGLHMTQKLLAALEIAGVEVVFSAEPALDPIRAMDAMSRIAKSDVDGVLLAIGTWIEAPNAIAAVREIEHLPFALWGFPMFERNGVWDSTGSFVAYAVVKGTLDRMAYRYARFMGLPEDEGVIQSALAFCRAAHAAERMKRTRIGLVGYASMGMYPGTVDHVLMRRQLGPEIEHVDTYSIVRRAEHFSREDCHAVMARLSQLATVLEEVHEERLLTAARLYLSLREWASERHLDALNVKCQYELSQEYGMTACIPLSLLAEDGLVSACEGDVLLGATMALVQQFSAEPVTYADVLDVRASRLLFSACGLAPFSLAATGQARCIRPFAHPGFHGLHCSFVLRPGTITFARLVEGIGQYSLLYGIGEGLQSELRQGVFPALTVEMQGDGEALLEALPSQHFALCYGDHSRELEALERTMPLKTCRL